MPANFVCAVRSVCFAISIGFAAFIAPATASAAEPDGAWQPATWLPTTTAAYAEISDPAPLLEAVLGAETLALLDDFEPYRKYRETKNYTDLQTVAAVLEAKLGAKWEPTLRTLLGGGAAVAFDPSLGSVTVVVRSRDAKVLNELHAAIVELVEADAKNKGKDSPIKQQEYNGAAGWSFGKNEAHVILGDTLVVSNRSEALKQIVDRRAKRASDKSPAKSLAGDANFVAARKQVDPAACGFGFVRLSSLRLAMGLAKLLDKKADNPVAEVLAGGVVDAVGRADYVAVGLTIDKSQARLSAHLPYERKNTATTRRWFFAPEAGAAAAAPLDVRSAVATLTAYRDVGGMWTGRNELFDEKTNVGFTEADTNLGLYFSGRDFGSQVLGELSPRWRLVAARREFGDDGQPVPALKLPSFGLVWELAHPDEFGPHLQMAFQNIIGITNLDGVQKGRPQLLLKSETRGAAEIQYGTYLIVGDVPKTDAPMHFNFRPACGRIGKHFVLGTHVDLVREICDGLEKQPKAPSTTDSLRFEVRTDELTKVLEANRPLILGRVMLSAGGDKEKAEAQLALGLRLLEPLKDLKLELIEGKETLSLQIGASFRDAGARK